MTEKEWLASDDPIRLLDWVGTPFGLGLRDRLRTTILFGVACVDRGLKYRGNTEDWLIRRAEELADGIPDEEPHITQAHGYFAQRTSTGQCLLLLLEQASRLSPYAVANETARAVAEQKCLFGNSDQREDVFRAEQVAQAAILRDIYNPFRPATFDPSWRTSDAVLLAQRVYDDRDFSAMPILADALQDAGCDSDDILSHCRDTSATHVRGCWVVDLVLGKS